METRFKGILERVKIDETHASIKLPSELTTELNSSTVC